jgi:hypothetical protein
VAAQAQLHSYTVAYWWSAAFFAAGSVITFLLFRPGKPRIAALSADAEDRPPAAM